MSSLNPERVLVVYNKSRFLIKGEPQDLLAEQGVIACAQAVADGLATRYAVERVPIDSDVESTLASYSPAEWVVFNLGEGVQGRLFEEARIAWALEAMGYRMTGSRGDALARSIHKAQAKELFGAAGIPTPNWRLCRSTEETHQGLRFPLIVKPVAEDGSIGISPEAVVHDLVGLRERGALHNRVVSAGRGRGGVHHRARVQCLAVGRPSAGAAASPD